LGRTETIALGNLVEIVGTFTASSPIGSDAPMKILRSIII